MRNRAIASTLCDGASSTRHDCAIRPRYPRRPMPTRRCVDDLDCHEETITEPRVRRAGPSVRGSPTSRADLESRLIGVIEQVTARPRLTHRDMAQARAGIYVGIACSSLRPATGPAEVFGASAVPEVSR